MSCEDKGSVTLVRQFFEADGGRKLSNTELLACKTAGVQELAEMVREQNHKERTA